LGLEGGGYLVWVELDYAYVFCLLDEFAVLTELLLHDFYELFQLGAGFFDVALRQFQAFAVLVQTFDLVNDLIRLGFLDIFQEIAMFGYFDMKGGE
jgi:hypothetical protein